MANPIVVLEINDRYVRAGFSKNNHFPAFEFPAIVGRPLQSQAQGISQADEAPTQEILVGDKCQDSKIRHLLAITHPVHMDVVQSWEDMFHLLDYTFQRLGIDNRIVCHRIFLSNFCIRESDLLNMVQAMFARYHFHSVYLADETLMTLYSCSLLTGVVVDVGEAITRITPVFEGYDMARTKCLNLAGRNVTECLIELLVLRGYPFSHSESDFEAVRMMVEELCFVAADPKRETRLAEMTTSHMASYHLCDGRDIKFGAERFQACEVLFQPYLFGIEGSGGLAEEVFDCIQGCDLDTRPQLWSHIIISGKATSLPGFKSRLEKELTKIYKKKILDSSSVSDMDRRIRVKVEDQRAFSNMRVFDGCSVLANIVSAPFCVDTWISRAEYDQKGITSELLVSVDAAGIGKRMVPKSSLGMKYCSRGTSLSISMAMATLAHNPVGNGLIFFGAGNRGHQDIGQYCWNGNRNFPFPETNTADEAKCSDKAKSSDKTTSFEAAAEAKAAAEVNTAAEAKASTDLKGTVEAKLNASTPVASGGTSAEVLPLAFIQDLRGLSRLRAQVSSMQQVIGDAVALADSAVVTQEQIDNCAIIQAKAELQLHFHAVCQGLNSMLHAAAAFHSGVVELDKSSGFSSKLGVASEHHEDGIGAVQKAAAAAHELAAGGGAFEAAASATAKLLDGVAHLADGIPIASFVLKGASFCVAHVQGLKFDSRMKLIIKQLFPTLNPASWAFVVEEVARCVTVASAADIETLYQSTADDRGPIKNWFRGKCAEYGLAALTSKAEDSVVMAALQKVEAVTVLALNKRVPEGLEGKKLAEFIVGCIAPSASSASTATSTAGTAHAGSPHPTPSPGRSSPPPPVSLHDTASHSEVEQLRRKLEEQEVLNKKLAQAQTEQEEREKKRREQELAAQEVLNKKLEQAQTEQEEREKKREQELAAQEVLNKKLEQAQTEQEEREKKREQELAAMRKQIQKLAPQDKDKDEAGGGGGLVLASSKSEANADTVKAAAALAARPLEQQQLRLQRQVQELTDFIASHGDPLLKSHLEDLNDAAVGVMKKHVMGWQVRYMAVRRGTLFYGDTFKAAKVLADGQSPPSSTDRHVVSLRGCRVKRSPEESDPSHMAFVLTTAQGEEMLWSTSDASLRLAIMETIGRYCESTAAPAALQHSSDEDQRRLLLGKLDASRARGAQGEAEDFS